MIYERAVAKLPGSYKLWMRYLTERRERVAHLPITHPAYKAVNHCYDRALVHMHKMPLIWRDYCSFLASQQLVTTTRHAFDRALRSLPITQHLRWIWPEYLKFVKKCGVPETAIRVYRRYLRLEPTSVEDFIDYLKKVKRLDEAAKQLANLVNDENFISQRGKSKHDLWSELLKMVVHNPQQITDLNVEAIIRSGIRRFAHEVGRLWTSLADYYIRLSQFEKARDVYEEGVNTVNTVRDFDLIFSAYTKFEEGMIEAQMELQAEQDEKEAELEAEDVEVDLRLARLEDLMNRRPLLLSSVLLRQNPHNVQEWYKRVALFKGDPEKIIQTYTEAVTTIDPQKATGKPHQLWISFARFYEQHEDLENARVILEKAALVNYKTVDDLANIWCEWAEMELRHHNYKMSLEVMKKATRPPKHRPRYEESEESKNLSVQDRLYKCTRIWSLYADLEENLGTLESTKAVYEQMVYLKVATPQIIINYANLMEEHKYFEDSFRVYEKGISLFTYPHVLPIWLDYLKKFISRYGGKKVERTRDLFEQAVEKAPAKDCKDLYLLYAKFEEDYGLARRAMSVYERACRAVEQKDRAKMYEIYISRCADYFGVAKTREIYEKALQALPDSHVKNMAIKYATLERRLGEIDRARALYTYCSQFCDPKVDAEFWRVWHDFELSHGNEDTFKEMLRIKRSVQAQFSQLSMMTANLTGAAAAGASAASASFTPASSSAAASKRKPETAMEALEAAVAGDSSGSSSQKENGATRAAPGAMERFKKQRV